MEPCVLTELENSETAPIVSPNGTSYYQTFFNYRLSHFHEKYGNTLMAISWPVVEEHSSHYHVLCPGIHFIIILPQVLVSNGIFFGVPRTSVVDMCDKHYGGKNAKEQNIRYSWPFIREYKTRNHNCTAEISTSWTKNE